MHSVVKRPYVMSDTVSEVAHPVGFLPKDYLPKYDVRTRGRGSMAFWAKVGVRACDCLILCKGITDGAQIEFVEISDRDDLFSFLTPLPYPSCQVHAFCRQAPVRDVGYGFGSCAPCGVFSLRLRTEIRCPHAGS